MLCAAVLSMVMLIAFLPLNAFAIEADPDPNVLYYSLTDICRQNAMERGMDWVHPNQYRVQAEYAGTFCLNGPGATREIRKEVQEAEEIVFPSLVPGYSYQWSITDEDGTARQHGVFNPYGSLRVIPLEGVYNVRDMGGWPTGSGTLRYGLLFRGSALEYNEYRLARDADLQELRIVQFVPREVFSLLVFAALKCRLLQLFVHLVEQNLNGIEARIINIIKSVHPVIPIGNRCQ